MLNPDGVFLGNQRSDLLGGDLNRSWDRATSYAHPALVAVNDLLKKIASEKVSYIHFHTFCTKTLNYKPNVKYVMELASGAHRPPLLGAGTAGSAVKISFQI